jgi:predicted nucleic acid-binding protein
VPRDVLYLDSSALVKLVVEEAESEALRLYLEEREQRLSSIVADIEVRRAARRAGGEAALDRAAEVLGGVNLLALDSPVVELAAKLLPGSLRTLNAIHIASALSLGAEIGPFITYDARQLEAATAAGLDVDVPT